MKKMLHKLAIVITVITHIFLLNQKTVFADDSLPVASMFVTPMSQRILLAPGDTYRGVISISNSANAQQNLFYSVKVGPYNLVRDEERGDDYGSFDVEKKTERNTIVDWITLSKSNGEIKPNETDKVLFEIIVPENAPAGSQYASIIINNDTTNEEESNGTVINSKTQIASAIYANIAGKTIEKGSIVENSMPSFLLNNQLEATSMVKNEGNVYTDAEYMLQVWPMGSDEEICTNEEDIDTSLVLPDTERYHSQTCQLPPVGIFRAKQTVKIFGEESIVEKTIIVCPIWLLFIIIFAIFAIIFYFIAKAKARKKSPARSGNSPAPQQ